MNFWFETGTPTLLITLIKKNKYNLSFLDNPQLSPNSMVASHEFSELPMTDLLFQLGYFTIDKQVADNHSSSGKSGYRAYHLSFPNEEVRVAFSSVILRALRNKETTDEEINLGKVLEDNLNEGDWKSFADNWNQLLAHLPSNLHISKESYYHSLLLMFVTLYDFNFDAERKSSIGQVDMAVELEDKIYIIEFKINKSAKVALEQIYEKRYFDVYLSKDKPIYLVGISFQVKLKQMSDILVENFYPKKPRGKAK